VAADPVTSVFSALADPTRRHLIEALARGPASTTGLAGELPMTRQAVAKHVTALNEAGLVRRARAGREVLYELTPEAMRDAARWMASVAADWDVRLARLADLLAEPDRGPRG
jgi:DNA-binding transcriptional ArsR family regulator